MSQWMLWKLMPKSAYALHGQYRDTVVNASAWESMGYSLHTATTEVDGCVLV